MSYPFLLKNRLNKFCKENIFSFPICLIFLAPLFLGFGEINICIKKIVISCPGSLAVYL
ncbi:hypothetical protein HMPREF0322_03119 [Desulfitobacterium hafniense DP7]|uniref:Uncharacterized protein n=1 Tax=Desulfitobacterium hafniense DP7 TaxID=537010 RepID=G9XQ72_DESHA|nr:hypothetical protein HMPREF0322_03119 [Desulfitobacterium hafniense DP7]